MAGLDTPRGPEVAVSKEARIEQLREAIPQLEAKIDSTLQRALLGRQLPQTPQTAKGDGARWESFEDNYGTLIENKVELFLLSGVPEQLQRELDFFKPPFPSITRETIQNVLNLFEIKTNSKGEQYSNLTQRFGAPNHRMTQVKVGMLNEHIEELKKINATTSHPRQKAFLEKLMGTLQSIIDMDILAKKDLDRRKNSQPSKLGKLGRYGRLLGGALAVGLALFSLIANRGKPNIATALYIGLGYLAFKGTPKGKLAAERNQIKGFGSAAFEKFADKHSIQGLAWADFTEELSEKGIGKLARNVKKDLKSKLEPGEDKETRDEKLKTDFAKDIAESNTRVHQSFRAMTHEERIQLISMAQRAKSDAAKESLHQFIQYRKEPLPTV